MDFRRGARREEPEMNLVPMIDVLLVIVIFLVVTTTY
jgi:biopolymer transport protein ExbD